MENAGDARASRCSTLKLWQPPPPHDALSSTAPRPALLHRLRHLVRRPICRITPGRTRSPKGGSEQPMNDIGVVDPNVDPRTNDAPVPFRVGNGIPAPAIDPETGDLYVVWEDARFTGQDETVITRSTNAATLSSPKRVNTPGGPAFTPVVAVTDSGRDGVAGTVGVTYHQLGASSSRLSPTTDFIKRFSAVAAGDSSRVDTGVAANTVFGPFNMLDALLARGYSSATTSPC